MPEGQERSFPFVCVGNKSDVLKEGKKDDKQGENVDLEEVKKLLEELCPPLDKESRIEKTAQPSAVPCEFTIATIPSICSTMLN